MDTQGLVFHAFHLGSLHGLIDHTTRLDSLSQFRDENRVELEVGAQRDVVVDELEFEVGELEARHLGEGNTRSDDLIGGRDDDLLQDEVDHVNQGVKGDSTDGRALYGDDDTDVSKLGRESDGGTGAILGDEQGESEGNLGVKDEHRGGFTSDSELSDGRNSGFNDEATLELESGNSGGYEFDADRLVGMGRDQTRGDQGVAVGVAEAQGDAAGGDLLVDEVGGNEGVSGGEESVGRELEVQIVR